MTILTTYAETDPASPLAIIRDRAAVIATLAALGVNFTHRPPPTSITTAQPPAAVLAAADADISALKQAGGYQSADVVTVTPDDQAAAAKRTKFLFEHTHAEDEVRWFVAGGGSFYLHLGDQIHHLVCVAGDLIAVPAKARHWFDMGPTPYFTAVRLFTNPDGWVATATGAAIAQLFPAHVPAHVPEIRWVLTDVEGTTSDLAFVRDVLFPYAAKQLPAFVRAHAHESAARVQIDAVRKETGAEDDEAAIAVLLQWIAEDRKATPLKTLQGLIWTEGFAAGAFQSHVYPDAAEHLRRWQMAGLKLAVYSSGSVQAQRQFFAHTAHGDLTPLFSAHFDTTTGPKQERASYARIAAALGAEPGAVLFLSDTPAEIAAAKQAGLIAQLIARDVSEIADSAADFAVVHRLFALPG